MSQRKATARFLDIELVAADGPDFDRTSDDRHEDISLLLRLKELLSFPDTLLLFQARDRVNEAKRLLQEWEP